MKAMRQYARVRRRDGAYRLGIYRDIEAGGLFVEIFLVHSWAEHLRQHERQTKAGRELEQRVYSFIAGEPKVRHLLYADSAKLYGASNAQQNDLSLIKPIETHP